jgi:hypothetical protein
MFNIIFWVRVEHAWSRKIFELIFICDFISPMRQHFLFNLSNNMQANMDATQRKNWLYTWFTYMRLGAGCLRNPWISPKFGYAWTMQFGCVVGSTAFSRYYSTWMWLSQMYRANRTSLISPSTSAPIHLTTKSDWLHKHVILDARTWNEETTEWHWCFDTTNFHFAQNYSNILQT